MNPTEICNLALSILKSSPINDIDSKDDTKANLCKRWYELKRQNLLKENNWRFAIKEINLAKNNKNNFNLPSDLIKIIKFSDENAIQISQEAESDADNLKITYIFDVQDTSLFTPDFIETLSFSIAYNLSFDLIGDKSITQYIENQYLILLNQAKSNANTEFLFQKKKFKSNIIANRYV